MSLFTNAEADALSLDGLVNDNALVSTRRNGPKPSYQFLVDKWDAEFAAKIIEINKSRGFRVVGTFAAGFTYELLNDVGIDASGNSWIYTGTDELPKVITAGTVPSSPDFQQVTYNDHSGLVNLNSEGGHDEIYARSVNSLKSLVAYTPALIDGQKFDVTGFYLNTKVGGGLFIWDSSCDKSTHNGGTVISPEALTAWDGLQPNLSQLLSWTGTGNGCWVRINYSSIDAEFFGVTQSANNGVAIRHAAKWLSENGGGELKFKAKTYGFDYVILYRNVVFKGESEKSTVLKCDYDSAVLEVVATENFLSVVDSNDGVSENALVPSWFGIKDMQIDLGGRGASTYGGVAIYGAAPLIENVLIHNGANRGLYTEYARFPGDIDSIEDQEEGYIINLICRDNGGDGWYNLGPHNVYIGNYIGCLNGKVSGGWGYYSAITTNTLGAPTYADCIHCYSNDMTYDPSSGNIRKNIYIGVNMSCGVLVVDGGFCEIASSESLISVVKQYLGGQGNSDGLLISGSENVIGAYSGRMRDDGVSDGNAGECALRITGSNNVMATAKLNGSTVVTANNVVRGFGGLVVSGNSNKINGLNVRNSRVGVELSGSGNEIEGSITFADTAFKYTATSGRNSVKLSILGNTTFGSKEYVVGDRPLAGSDQFDIRAEGITSKGVKRTKNYFEQVGVDASITTAQDISIPHNLLYTPRRQDCNIVMTGSTGVLPSVDYMRVVSTDDTNINVQVKFSVAGTLTVNIGVSSVIF